MIMRRYLSFILLVNLLFWHVCVLGQEPAKPTDIQVEKAVQVLQRLRVCSGIREVCKMQRKV